MNVWSEFVTLVTDKFQPRHATHDLIQRIRSLKMKTYKLETYANDFERLKRLIPSNAQSDIDMMYTFINGLTDELRSKMMSKELDSYKHATEKCWRYYMAHSYGQ